MQIESVLQSIKTITTQVTSYTSLEKTAQKIVDEMNHLLSTAGGALLLTDDKLKIAYGYKYSRSSVGVHLDKILKVNFSDFKIDYAKPTNLIGKAIKQQKIIIGSSIEDFTYPGVPKMLTRTLQKLNRITKLMAVPVIMEGRVLGLIFLAFIGGEDEISDEKKFIIEIFADQVAIAINNALKYEELKKRLELERETTSLLSHELKTPIAITNNSAQTLKMLLQKVPRDFDVNLFESLIKSQREIHDGLIRMNSICNSIFNFREIENNVPTASQSVDLSRLLSQTIRLHKARAEAKGLKFKSSLKFGNQKQFTGKVIQFEQILNIVIDNAIKYTSRGVIDLKISVTPRFMKADISDTGPGIPPDQRRVIFDRFKRLEMSGSIEGLGLGLYMAKRIADELGGSILVGDSIHPNGGTRFIIKVPHSSGAPRRT